MPVRIRSICILQFAKREHVVGHWSDLPKAAHGERSRAGFPLACAKAQRLGHSADRVSAALGAAGIPETGSNGSPVFPTAGQVPPVHQQSERTRHLLLL